MAVNATDAALVIAAIGGAGGLVTAIGNYLLARAEAKKKDLKDARDEAERQEARRAQAAALAAIAVQADEIKDVVNGSHHEALKEIIALKDVVSKGLTVPEMPAAESAPGQVTRDGHVVSVGTEEPPKAIQVEQPSAPTLRDTERRETKPTGKSEEDGL